MSNPTGRIQGTKVAWPQHRDGVLPLAVWEDINTQSAYAHTKFGETSMLHVDYSDSERLAVLTEEVGEVARALNERRHMHIAADDMLYLELIQVAAVASGWAQIVAERAGKDQEELT